MRLKLTCQKNWKRQLRWCAQRR